MMTLIGKIYKRALITGYSALVLSLVLSLPGLSDEVSNGSSPQSSQVTIPLVSPGTESRAASTDASVSPLQDETLVQFIEAVTGKPVPEDIRNLVQGVIGLRRKGEAVELTKSDSSIVLIGADTEFAGRSIKDVDELKEKLTNKFGPEIGALMDKFVGLSVAGSHIEVIRDGPDLEDIDLSERKIKKQLPLKRVRLSRISLDVARVAGHCALKNISGIEVVPNAGLEIPIVLKEFSRSKNQEGDDVLTFGIKNPLPMLKPLRKLFGIKDIIPFTWTAKQKGTNEIGAKTSANEEE